MCETNIEICTSTALTSRAGVTAHTTSLDVSDIQGVDTGSSMDGGKRRNIDIRVLWICCVG